MTNFGHGVGSNQQSTGGGGHSSPADRATATSSTFPAGEGGSATGNVASTVCSPGPPPPPATGGCGIETDTEDEESAAAARKGMM